MPSTDGPLYLWMAQAFARGQFAAGLDCVFHPGWSLLLAPLVALGLDSFLAAKLLGALCGGCTAVLLWRIAHRWVAGWPAVGAALLFAGSFHAVRLPGDAYSESAYLVLVSLGLWLVLGQRPVGGGLAFGIAFWVRPEALCLWPLLWARPADRRRLWTAVSVATLGAMLYPALRFLALGELAATPKLGFMRPMGPLGADSLGSVATGLLRNAGRVPLAAMPALDWIGFPLGLAGLWLLQRANRRAARACLLALVLGWLAMIAFQVKPRFFLSQMPLLLPLAALTLRWAWPVVIVALGISLFRIGRDVREPPRVEKHAERELGRWLARRGVRAGELVTDLPRVAFYAGLRPPPPAIWTPARIDALLRGAAARWACLAAKRAGRRDLLERRVAWRPTPLPDTVRSLLGADRLLLARRR